jgi:hypothetical protein
MSPVKAKSARVETRGNFSGFMAFSWQEVILIDPISSTVALMQSDFLRLSDAWVIVKRSLNL